MERLFEKLKLIFVRQPRLRQTCVRRSVYWKDVIYHTGFYRFDEKYQKGGVTFKIGGVPCLAQDGYDKFVFFSETDLSGEIGLVCVEIHYG